MSISSPNLSRKFPRVCVVGLGYIGLPTAAVLAQAGFDVHGVDINSKAVEIINSGKIHIVEPDLLELVSSVVKNKKLVASLKPEVCEVYIIAVPTPFYHESKKPNIEYVLSATRSIANLIKPGDLIILESTSPVGTTEKMADLLSSLGVDINKIFIAHCPERVLPGKILYELVHNDRIVGGINPISTEKACAFYKVFVKGEVLQTNARTAELCKLSENAYRDVNIAFANELSMVCEDLNIDVWELRKLANHHPRVNILEPGCGVGGHCIAVDPWFIVDASDRAKLIKTAREQNLAKTDWVISKLKLEIEKIKNLNLRNNIKQDISVACLGASFKPNIDDTRESPAKIIIDALKDLGVNVLVVEPNLSDLDGYELMGLDQALEQADISVKLVSHREFEGVSCDIEAVG